MKTSSILLACASCIVLLACGGGAKRAAAPDARSAATRSSASSSDPANGGRPAAPIDPWEYGKALEGAERQAAKQMVERFYLYAGNDNGAGACRLLSHPLAESVVEDWGEGGGASYLHGKTCAVVMSKIFRHTPGQSLRSLSKVEVVGVRIVGQAGFALLKSPAMPHGEIPIRRYGKVWRLTAPIGVDARRTSGSAAG